MEGVSYTLVEHRQREPRSNGRGSHPEKWIYEYDFTPTPRKPIIPIPINPTVVLNSCFPITNKGIKASKNNKIGSTDAIPNVLNPV